MTIVFSQHGIGRIAAALLAATVFLVTAAVFRPEPVSDFLYYWMIADQPALYHKGGVVGWLFAPAKWFGISPYWSAALLNGAFAIVALYAVVPPRHLANGRTLSALSVIGTAVVVLAVLAAAPATPLVATDLMAFCAFVGGLGALMCASGGSGRACVAAAILGFGVSVSLRQVYAPVILICAVALPLIQHEIHAKTKTANRWKGRLTAVGFGVLIAFGGVVAAGLAERTLLRHSDTAQYGAGVVRAVIAIGHDMGDGATTCGAWSENRARFGLDNRAEPLVPFIWERQREVGWRNLPALYGCKISRLLGFRDWFAAWLQASREYSPDRILAASMGVDVSVADGAARLSHVERSEAQKRAFAHRANAYAMASGWIGGLLQITVLGFLAISYVEVARMRSRAFGLLALVVATLPTLVLIALHGMLFEVQPRYAFPIWLLPPVCMILILRAFKD